MDGRGAGGEAESEEEGIAKPENRFACRRKTLSLQRRKCGAEKIRLEINVLENVVSTTEGANANHVKAIRNAILHPVLSIFLETQQRFARVFYKSIRPQPMASEEVRPRHGTCTLPDWQGPLKHDPNRRSEREGGRRARTRCAARWPAILSLPICVQSPSMRSLASACAARVTPAT